MLASSSLRNGGSLPGILPVLIPSMYAASAPARPSSDRLRELVDGLFRLRFVVGLIVPLRSRPALAFAMTRPEPSALTFTFGPICIAVNEIALPPLKNSITAMLGWLMTEGCSFQPAPSAMHDRTRRAPSRSRRN